MRNRTHAQTRLFIFFLFLAVFSLPTFAQQKKALTVTDMMKFREIHNPVISEDGKWIAYAVQPDRGDGEAIVQSTETERTFRIERGSRPVISRNGKWVAATVLPKAVDMETKKKDKPKNGLHLLNMENGEILQREKVQKFVFSNNSRWLAYLHFKEEQKGKVKEKAKAKKNIGSELTVRNLTSGTETTFHFVKSFSFDSASTVLTFVVSDTNGRGNGLYFIDLKNNYSNKRPIMEKENGYFDYPTWNDKAGKLAFFAGVFNRKEKPDSISLMIWDVGKKKTKIAVPQQSLPKGWVLHAKNRLRWSKDGKRLFVGTKPESEIVPAEEEKKDEKTVDLFNIDEILKGRGVDIWHWNDPLINPNQKKMWNRIKDHTYRGVYHLKSGKFIQLADENVPDIQVGENGKYALGISNLLYQKMITWYGRLNDFYVIDLKNGSKKKVVSKIDSRASLSPQGNFVIYYDKKHWYLYNTKTGTTKNLTQNINAPFYNEDHDYPSPVPGYGVAGWTKGDKSVLIYDKYDIWQFPTAKGEPVNLTNGRKEHIIYRVQRLDPEQRFFRNGETLFLTAYHDLKKYTAFYSVKVGEPGVKKLIQEDKKFTLIAKAKKADKILFTRQSYTEFPDLWVSNTNLNRPKKISDVNPQVKDFAWGTAELVSWRSDDGIPMQGVLIKPGNYEPGKKYPVLVYYYRFFSQRLHEFNQVVVNHRPCFPFYASNGYAVFLPDIRFEVGRPGFAATKCLVPGVQKIIDMGIADANAIALHGHSWSGYQTAFVITQTDIFKCAIAGAPVSNMTSAYGGIRWGSGLARQFQYEQSQSRIGGTLWNALPKYIENSPLFYADRIHTPLLIMHGDKDDAVPWYQSIELYLAMRRLGKDCIFLEYRGEPHHPKKYANKLDYTLRMKEYLDHYLKGLPAPEWISKGVPYRGK